MTDKNTEKEASTGREASDLNVIVMRDKLRQHIDYDEGGRVRRALKEHAETNYQPRHTPAEYLAFMNQHECTFTVQHNQSTNNPYYWGLFTVKSQHVLGDCVEECLDKAMSA